MKRIKDLHTHLNTSMKEYQNYAALELVFSAYMLAEEAMEQENVWFERERELWGKTEELLIQISSGKIKNGLISVINNIRSEIIGKMDLFTAYADRITCYEYAMNRIEWKYKPEDEWSRGVTKEKEQQLNRELMSYIVQSKDQAVMNDKIRTVLGQLPIRMTKEKFYDRLKEAISLYKGDEQEFLDDFIYRIRTSGMIYEPEQFVGEYEEIETLLNHLETFDYADSDRSTFESVFAELQKGIVLISDAADFYAALQKNVNLAYSIVLTWQYSGKEEGIAWEALQTVGQIMKKDITEDLLIPFEGKIERYAEKYDRLEVSLYEIGQSYKEEVSRLGLEEQVEHARMVSLLLSGNLFMNLAGKEKNGIVDEAYIKEVSAKLISGFELAFAKNKKQVRRAMMSKVLEQLPMLFKTAEELNEYIGQALFQCQDKAEKMAVMNVLEQQMED